MLAASAGLGRVRVRVSGLRGRGRARVGVGVRVGAGVKARARVGHERAWVDNAVEVLVAGEEGIDEHDGSLPLYRFGAGLCVR